MKNFTPPRLSEIGIAGGLVAIILFAILGTVSGSFVALIAGCGMGMLLLIASLLGSRYTRSCN